MNTFKKYLLLVFASILFIGSFSTSLACPNCKEAFSETSETGQKNIGPEKEVAINKPAVKQRNVGDSYSLSVLFMLFVPMSIVGGIGYKIYAQTKQSRSLHVSGENQLK